MIEEKVLKVFARRYSSDGEDIEENPILSDIKFDEDEAKRLRRLVIAKKLPIYKILSSKKQVSSAADDNFFLKKIDEVYPNKNYANLIKHIDDINKLSEVKDEDIINEAAMKVGRISRNSKIVNTLAEGMESPGKELIIAIINATTEAMKENKLLRAKVKILKNDEVNLGSLLKDKDLGKTIVESTKDDNLKKVTGISDEKLNKLKDAYKNNRDPNKDKDLDDLNNHLKIDKDLETDFDEYDDEDDIDEGMFNKSDLYIEVKDDASLLRLGRALGKKVHKDDYDEAIVLDIIKNAKEKFGNDNWNALASYLKNVYRSAYEVNFSERLRRSFGLLDVVEDLTTAKKLRLDNKRSDIKFNRVNQDDIFDNYYYILMTYKKGGVYRLFGPYSSKVISKITRFFINLINTVNLYSDKVIKPMTGAELKELYPDIFVDYKK